MSINLRPLRLVDQDEMRLISLLGDFREAQRERGEAELRFAEAEARLMTALGERKTAKVGSHRVTVVRRETTKVDEPKLKKLLGAKLWNKVAKSVLDRGKLESAISTGEVSLDVVASASTIVPSKPYLRLSDDGPEEADHRQELPES